MKTKTAYTNKGIVTNDSEAAAQDLVDLKERDSTVEKIDIDFFLKNCFEVTGDNSSWAFELVFDNHDSQGRNRFIFFDADYDQPSFILGKDRAGLMLRPEVFVTALTKPEAEKVVRDLVEDNL